MNSRFLMAVLAAFVAMFLAGWLIWGVLLKDYMAKSMVNPPNEADGNIGLIACGNFVMAFVYSWIGQGMGVNSLMKGLMNGFIVGCLFALGTSLIGAGMGPMYTDNMAMVADILAVGVWGALGMGAAGMVMGMKKKEA